MRAATVKNAALACIVLLLPAAALAQTTVQFDPLLYASTFEIQLSPAYPQPGQTVALTLSSDLDLSGAAIVWRAGGKVIAQGTGATDASIVAGALGSRTPVEVDATLPDGTPLSATAVIAPSELDLLTEADSYIPPFYRGRALPSAGTDIIAEAMTHLIAADGSAIPDANIIYTWKLNGRTLSLSGAGRSSAIIPVEHMYTPSTIEVDALSLDGTRGAQATAIIPSATPVLDLYEDHPLYGIEWNNALGASASVPESEMSFVGVPYFADAQNLADPLLQYAWTINGQSVAPSTTTPSEVTINAAGSTGEAEISLDVTHQTNFYLNARGAWNLSLSPSASDQNPFTSPFPTH